MYALEEIGSIKLDHPKCPAQCIRGCCCGVDQDAPFIAAYRTEADATTWHRPPVFS